MTTALESFLAFHDQFHALATQAYSTGDMSALLSAHAPGYHGHFGTRQEDRASLYDLGDAIEGVRQTAKAYPGVRASLHNRHVRMPSDEEAIVFYEKAMDFGSKVGYAFVLEVWRQIDGPWLLVRETVETA